ESGAHWMLDFSPSPEESCFKPVPSSWAIHTSSRPDLSERKAINLPSGDHAGPPSRENDWVTRWMSPRSVATVKISPCTETAARLVVGERSYPSVSFRTVMVSIEFSLSSETILILMGVDLPLLTSSFQITKSCSYTMVLPSLETEGYNNRPP